MISEHNANVWFVGQATLPKARREPASTLIGSTLVPLPELCVLQQTRDLKTLAKTRCSDFLWQWEKGGRLFLGAATRRSFCPHTKNNEIIRLCRFFCLFWSCFFVLNFLEGIRRRFKVQSPFFFVVSHSFIVTSLVWGYKRTPRRKKRWLQLRQFCCRKSYYKRPSPCRPSPGSLFLGSTAALDKTALTTLFSVS